MMSRGRGGAAGKRSIITERGGTGSAASRRMTTIEIRWKNNTIADRRATNLFAKQQFEVALVDVHVRSMEEVEEEKELVDECEVELEQVVEVVALL